jgi:hypothetical protein
MSGSPEVRDDETDDASCLSYFSSFNRVSFETGTNDAVPQHGGEPVPHEAPTPADSDLRGVPHPPMRSTITPIAIAIPAPNITPPVATPTRKSRKRTTPSKKSDTSPPITPMPPAVTTGPVAALVQQHNHTMASQLSAAGSMGGEAIPTIILQPQLVNLTPHQQQVAAQLQDQFFRYINNVGQHSASPLAVIAPNPAALQTPPIPSPTHGAGAFQQGGVPIMSAAPHQGTSSDAGSIFGGGMFQSQQPPPQQQGYHQQPQQSHFFQSGLPQQQGQSGQAQYLHFQAHNSVAQH